MGLPHSTLKSRRRSKSARGSGLRRLHCLLVGCQLHKCATTYLKAKHGDYVKLSKKSKELKLVTKSLPDGAITDNLEIWKWDSAVALCFKSGSDIFVVTEHENKLTLKLLHQTTENAMKEKIQALNPWFKMDKVGHFYSIQATKSKRYLTIDKTRVTLSDMLNLESTFTTCSCRCNREGCPGV